MITRRVRHGQTPRCDDWIVNGEEEKAGSSAAAWSASFRGARVSSDEEVELHAYNCENSSRSSGHYGDRPRSAGHSGAPPSKPLGEITLTSDVTSS